MSYQLPFPSPLISNTVGCRGFRTSLNDASELAPQRRREHGLRAGDVGRMLRRRRARRRGHGIDEGVGMRIGESDDCRSGSSTGSGGGGGAIERRLDGTVVFGEQKAGDPFVEKVGVRKCDASTDARRLLGSHFDWIEAGLWN